MSLAYAKYFASLERLINDVTELMRGSGSKSLASTVERLDGARARLRAEAPLRLVLIGEFSAGKSSLISALTGAAVKIDADVTTDQTADYPWNGLLLVDTPGVQAQATSTNHDRIARDATIGADLVLFVLTNELFSPRLAAHLRYLIDDDGLALSRKTCVVVNKIDRETNDDSMILGEVAKVLGPHQEIPVYLCSAGKFLRSSGEAEPNKSRFERQSRFVDLVNGLDSFVSDAGSAGKLATPLALVAEILDEVQSELAASDDDRKRLEIVRRQKVVLNRLQRRLLDIRKTWKQQAYSTVMGQANEAVEQLSEISRKEDLESLFESGLKQAAAEIEQLYDGVESELREALEQATSELDEIGDSPLGQEVSRIEMQRAERVGVEFGGARPDSASIIGKMAKAAGKPIQEGIEAAAKNSQGMRDLVYNVGKAMGKKFRPYEAVKGGEKLASALGKFGKAIPVFTAALDFYLQYREEKAKEEKERYAAGLRLSLRSAFADQARVEAEALEAVVLATSRGPVQKGIEDLDDYAGRIATTGRDRVDVQARISVLKSRTSALRDEIYAGPANAP